MKQLLTIVLTAALTFTLTNYNEVSGSVLKELPKEVSMSMIKNAISEKIDSIKNAKDKKSIVITPEETVTNILTAIKNVNADELNIYGAKDLIGSTDTLNNDRNKKIFEELEFEVLSSEQIENIAKVRVQIKTKDLTTVPQTYADASALLTKENNNLGEIKLDEIDMKKKYSDLFIETIDKCQYEEFSRIVNLNLKLVDNVWQLELDSLFHNALYGNMIVAQSNVVWP